MSTTRWLQLTREEPAVPLCPAHRSNVICLPLISEDTVSGVENGSVRIWVGSEKGGPPPSLTSVKPLVQCLSSNHHLLIGEILLYSQKINAICQGLLPAQTIKSICTRTRGMWRTQSIAPLGSSCPRTGTQSCRI